VVDTQADKDVANVRANSVSGVFKVVNNLQVVGGAPRRQRNKLDFVHLGRAGDGWRGPILLR
jgi:hypothetical protein